MHSSVEGATSTNAIAAVIVAVIARIESCSTVGRLDWRSSRQSKRAGVCFRNNMLPILSILICQSGLRCTQNLKKGQFIDTYRGEIITHEEANRRGEIRPPDQKDIYYMNLDKFSEDHGGSKYVCDGMHLGGPTRFINHSCDPNCAIYTVSYNHADHNIYDLAFFATEAITAGTELTFNYADDDRTDIITEEQADEMEKENGYRPVKCECGSSRCRGYFFT